MDFTFFLEEFAKTFLVYPQTKAHFRNPGFTVFLWLCLLMFLPVNFHTNTFLLLLIQIAHTELFWTCSVHTFLFIWQNIQSQIFWLKKKSDDRGLKLFHPAPLPRAQPVCITACSKFLLSEFSSSTYSYLDLFLLLWQTASHTSPRYSLEIPGLLGFWFFEETTCFVVFASHKEPIDLPISVMFKGQRILWYLLPIELTFLWFTVRASFLW